MLDPVHNRSVSGPAALDPNSTTLSDPAFVREAHQLMHYYVRYARHHWLLLVALPLAGAAVAAGVTRLPADTYEATAKMLASGDPPASTYLRFLQSQSVADEALQALKLDESKTGLTREELLQSAFRAEVVRNTNVLAATVTLQDPQAAATLANRMSLTAIDHSRRAKNIENALALRDLLRTHLDGARVSVERATALVLEHREKTRIDALRKSLDPVLAKRGQLSELSVRIDEARAHLTRAQADLASLSRIDALRWVIGESTVLAEATRVTTTKQPIDTASLSGNRVRADEVNRVYDSVNRQIAAARGALGDLERRRTRLLRVQRLTRADRQTLSQLYAAERELARLELERTLRENAFSEAFNRYEFARLNVAREGELSMLELAVPPDRPVARGTARNTILGSLIGFIFALVAIIWRAR
jgi:capsular polysaccharide biosynthesis protein